MASRQDLPRALQASTRSGHHVKQRHKQQREIHDDAGQNALSRDPQLLRQRRRGPEPAVTHGPPPHAGGAQYAEQKNSDFHPTILTDALPGGSCLGWAQKPREAFERGSPNYTMMPPPRHTSPSYSTADWPGVTAHCASRNSSAKPSCRANGSTQAASDWR